MDQGISSPTSEISAAGLPPKILLNPYRVSALGDSANTLAVGRMQNGQAADNTASLGFWGNQGIGGLRNGASADGLNAVRQAIPAVSPRHGPSFYPKQEWAGRVIAIRKNEFDARLRDLASGQCEVATIDLAELSLKDRDRIYIDLPFHWVMGYETVNGIRSNVSRIVFLDPPRVTERKLKAGRMWADRLRAKWNLD